jgi:hypothetical protein
MTAEDASSPEDIDPVPLADLEIPPEPVGVAPADEIDPDRLQVRDGATLLDGLPIETTDGTRPTPIPAPKPVRKSAGDDWPATADGLPGKMRLRVWLARQDPKTGSWDVVAGKISGYAKDRKKYQIRLDQPTDDDTDRMILERTPDRVFGTERVALIEAAASMKAVADAALSQWGHLNQRIGGVRYKPDPKA